MFEFASGFLNNTGSDSVRFTDPSGTAYDSYDYSLSWSEYDKGFRVARFDLPRAGEVREGHLVHDSVVGEAGQREPIDLELASVGVGKPPEARRRGGPRGHGEVQAADNELKRIRP